MNIEILTLQRDILLEQLMELEEKLSDNSVKRNAKGFSLFLRNGVFAVKYTDLQTGKQIPTNRSLGTADRSEAEILAKKYRESILKSYYDKKNKIKDIITFFGEYYQLEKSTYLQEILKTGRRKISSPIIKHYEGFIKNYFIPFLQEKKIQKLNGITIEKLRDFQTFLLEKELTPKTINNNISGAIKPIFDNLILKGVLKKTPFIENIKFNLPEKETRNRRHTLPIYETLMVLIDQEMWKLYKAKDDKAHHKIANEKHYKKYRLLCLLMATCGLRNAEIFMLRKENIVKIRRTYFIDVVNSHIGEKGLKTENAKRKVPIPAITLQALNEYIEENNITDYLFYSGSKTIHYNMFGFASNQFGAHCGYTEKELKEEKNFDFYSLRHFYKTMLSRSNIKDDIIEYFSGRSVNVRNMSENYNNREDLDDIFFEENGLKVIEYIDNLCEKVHSKYTLFPIVYKTSNQVELTDNKGNTKSYYTDVLLDMDFDTETYLFITDLQDRFKLPPDTNDKNELLNALKGLYESEGIDKRRYDDCVDFLKNVKDFTNFPMPYTITIEDETGRHGKKRLPENKETIEK